MLYTLPAIRCRNKDFERCQQWSLRVFEMSVLRKILGFKRRDLKKLATDKNAVEVLHTRRLSYFGHVAPMDCHRYPHILLHSYVHRTQDRGRPRKKWIEILRRIANCFSSHGWMPTDLLRAELTGKHYYKMQSWSCQSRLGFCHTGIFMLCLAHTSDCNAVEWFWWDWSLSQPENANNAMQQRTNGTDSHKHEDKCSKTRAIRYKPSSHHFYNTGNDVSDYQFQTQEYRKSKKPDTWQNKLLINRDWPDYAKHQH